jgi:hypothetical protein
MSRYQLLTERLAGHPEPEWRASFAEIEEVLGFPLPRAARRGAAWWLDDGKPHVRAWYGPGWSIGQVDHTGGTVTFRRQVSEPALQGAPGPVASAKPGRRAKQPLDMRIGAEVASVISRAPRWGRTAALAGGAAVLGAIGALVIRGKLQRRDRPEA